MNKQPTRRRATRGAARTLTVGVAVAALVAMIGAGQALAAVAVPDERVLERQSMIDRQKTLGQTDEKGRVALPPQRSSEEQAAAKRERRYGRAPAGGRGGLAISVAVAALLLAVGATTTWRVRHRRPQPESTA
jgi:hypothetical protein